MPLPPIPPPDVAAVFIFAGNEQHGPMSRRELLAHLDAARFSDDDLFWYAEVEGWTRLGEHPELVSDLRPQPAPSTPSSGSFAVPDSFAPAGSFARADSFAPGDSLASDSSSVDPSLLRTTALSSEDLHRAVGQGTGGDDSAAQRRSGPQAAAGGQTSVQPRAASDPADEGSSMATIAMSAASVAEAVARSQSEAPEPAEPSVAPSAGFTEHAAGSAHDHELDRLFVDLVESSWAWVSENRFAEHIDEVFLGALITGTLDAGFSLIDLSSDGTHHYLRFESLEGAGGVTKGSRLIVRLRHLTGDLARARVLGQRASVVIGYGEKAPNAQQVIQALKAELKSGFLHDAEPGTITVDGDLKSGYIYAQVDLHWRLDDYVGEDYRIASDKITRHVSACAHALRKYLRGRFA